jgi:hypothetical protein
MAALRNVPTITAVALLDCVIQPDAVAEIAAMTSLRHLSLAGTKITEEDLGTLARLCYLEELVVSEAGLTREGLTRFKELLPACRVQLYAEVPRRTAKKA